MTEASRTIHEKCSCGAEFTVTGYTLADLRIDVEKWREVHKHEARVRINTELTGEVPDGALGDSYRSGPSEPPPPPSGWQPSFAETLQFMTDLIQANRKRAGQKDASGGVWGKATGGAEGAS